VLRLGEDAVFLRIRKRPISRIEYLPELAVIVERTSSSRCLDGKIDVGNGSR